MTSEPEEKEETSDATPRRPAVKVRVVPAEEIAKHPTRSLHAEDYISGGASGEQGEAD